MQWAFRLVTVVLMALSSTNATAEVTRGTLRAVSLRVVDAIYHQHERSRCAGPIPTTREGQMSFDLMVFDPGAVPLDREGFLAWYERQFEEEEGHIFDEPSVCAPELRAWFLDMIQLFPALNGPYANRVPSDPKCADYGVARTSIYASFRWSEAGNAYEAAIKLAKKHKVGFFDVSANDGAVWVPDPNGGYIRLHGL